MSELNGGVPPLPSRDAELLRALPPRESDTWASRALRTLLESVTDDPSLLTFEIAVTDAWTDGGEAFCVVYTPPLGRELVVGHRRQRGDKRPNHRPLLSPDFPDHDVVPFDPEVDLAMPDDAEEFAWQVADDIGDSLGVFAKHLRYDSDGLGWWGTLTDTLPVRPAT